MAEKSVLASRGILMIKKELRKLSKKSTQAMKTFESANAKSLRIGLCIVWEGDLVRCGYSGDAGLVIKIHNNVEIPPLVEVLWDSGYVSKTSMDDVEVINNE